MAQQKGQELRERTTKFSLSIIRLTTSLPRTREAEVLGRQVLRSATSVGAQYREAGRGKSMADFISKMEGSVQELDETDYWLELLAASGIVAAEKIAPLRDETSQLIGMFVTRVKNAKEGLNK